MAFRNCGIDKLYLDYYGMDRLDFYNISEEATEEELEQLHELANIDEREEQE